LTPYDLTDGLSGVDVDDEAGGLVAAEQLVLSCGGQEGTQTDSQSSQPARPASLAKPLLGRAQEDSLHSAL